MIRDVFVCVDKMPSLSSGAMRRESEGAAGGGQRDTALLEHVVDTLELAGGRPAPRACTRPTEENVANYGEQRHASRHAQSCP